MLIRKILTLKVLQTTIAFLLMNACYGLCAEVVVGNAFDITPDLPSLSGQYKPKVAFDGSDTFLVVWEERFACWTF